MKLIGRSTLLACLLIGYALGVASGVRAATATVALLPGSLVITDAPTTLNYTAATTADETRAYTTTFTISVTDATGSRAGWHIQAALGPLMGDTGAFAFVGASTITGESITTQTGRTPLGILAYPRTLRADGDTLFSAAAGSGMGRASLAFTAGLRVPADSIASDQCSAALTVSILSGP